MDATQDKAGLNEEGDTDVATRMDAVIDCRHRAPRSLRIVIEVPVARVWHRRLGERLEARGHRVCLEARTSSTALGPAVLLVLERLLYGARSALFETTAPMPRDETGRADVDLVICLEGRGRPENIGSTGEHLHVLYDGVAGEAALIGALLAGRAPVIGVTRERFLPAASASPDVVSSGLPAIEDDAVLARALDHVLARVVVLVAQAVGLMAAADEGPTLPGAAQAALQPSARLAARGRREGSVSAFFARSLARKVALRVARHEGDRWHSSWRFASGPGVNATHDWPARRYATLPDDDTGYYADPFPFEVDGRSYLFCEKFAFATGKGLIVVFEIGDDGSVSPARPVLEHAAHLSYPQVFARDGAIFMLPEMGAAGRIELFRAVAFPDRWVSHAVLVDDVVAADTTVVEHEGRLWLFTTLAGDGGSSWDQLALFHARSLEGSWLPHPGNPVVVDAGCARSAGNLWSADGALWRVAQDCRTGYGAGLSICRIDRLDPQGYRQTLVRRLGSPPGLDATGVHTLNRSARIEVFDWRAPRSGWSMNRKGR